MPLRVLGQVYEEFVTFELFGVSFYGFLYVNFQVPRAWVCTVAATPRRDRFWKKGRYFRLWFWENG